MSLIDREFLKWMAPDAVLMKTLTIKVRGVGNAIHECGEYAVIDLWIPGFSNGTEPTVAHIQRAVRPVDKLAANMLVGVDILGPEEVELNMKKRRITIESCGDFYTNVTVTPGTRIQGVIQAKKKVVIPPKSKMEVPIVYRRRLQLPQGKDFLLEPARINIGPGGGIEAAIVDANTSVVMVVNTTNEP
jgi:hypothetical protein